MPTRPPISGLNGPDALGPGDGVHLLHSMGDTFAVMRTLQQAAPASAVIVGAGYIGLEMAEALTARGLAVTQMEQLPEVLPTVDPEMGALVHAELEARGAIAVDTAMRTGVPDMFAAGDCVITHHRLLGETYLPLGTTAHKQGRVAGENALGGNRVFAGSLGTQVVKIFDQAAARTGLRDHEARAAGFDPVTIASGADDHKAYYPGSHRIHMRVTGDRATGRLLGVQLFGHKHAEIAKRIDIAATAISHAMTVAGVSDLDLSYTPPLGSPWDAVQIAAQAWARQAEQPGRTEG
jgi:NADPH-dependent 2,4-dienoyl-CoA reductase/sulfur reductase-like enzyme